MTDEEQRQAVIKEALSWEGTRYHHMGRIKIRRNENGEIVEPGGIDCAQLVYMVFHNCGLTPEMPLYNYSPQEYLNRNDQKFLKEILGRAHETKTPLPGDVVLFWQGRGFGHGGIVMPPGWPTIIHAHQAADKVMLDDGSQGQMQGRKKLFLTIWGDAS